LLDSLLQEIIHEAMLSQLVKSLGELALKPRTNTTLIHQTRNLVGVTCNNAGGVSIKSSILLLPSAIAVLNKRTFFEAMDSHGRGETAKDGYGVVLYSDKDGKRKPLKAVELRFKRLDWGMWIRPRAGRDKKHWKKDTHRQRMGQKHLFCATYHNRRFDRAVMSELKEQRHIPDDPYKVYNDLSFQQYHAIKRNNSEKVKKYGNKIYDWNWFVAHYKKDPCRKDRDYRFWYEPPGYHKVVADGDSVYNPDPAVPYDDPVPHYQLEERNKSKQVARRQQGFRRFVREHEPYMGIISQCSPLKLPVYGTTLG
jgi:hypothetical protein